MEKTKIGVGWIDLHRFLKSPQCMLTVISFEEKRVCLDELDELDKMGQSEWDESSEKTIKGDGVYFNFSSALSVCSMW